MHKESLNLTEREKQVVIKCFSCYLHAQDQLLHRNKKHLIAPPWNARAYFLWWKKFEDDCGSTKTSGQHSMCSEGLDGICPVCLMLSHTFLSGAEAELPVLRSTSPVASRASRVSASTGIEPTSFWSVTCQQNVCNTSLLAAGL